MQIQYVIDAAIEYFNDDVKRINHFFKVYEYAKMIAFKENVDEETKNILEVAAVLHDIGIKNAEKKYNSTAGNYQEIEGPPVADEILIKLGYKEDIRERVKYLIAHHHTYNEIDGIDYQILVEADFLVNIYEDAIYNKCDISQNENKDDLIESRRKKLYSIKNKIFKTNTGIRYLDCLFINNDNFICR